MSLRISARSAVHLTKLPVIAAVLACFVPQTLSAKPLDAETCQRLKGDVQGLEQQGIRDLMAKGPQTARSLNAAQLDKIRMLMDLDGQVRFRCGELPAIKLKDEPPEEQVEAGAAPATIDNATPGITLPPGAEAVGAVVPPIRRRPPATPPAAAGKAASAVPANAKAPSATQPAAPAPKPAAPPAKAAQPNAAKAKAVAPAAAAGPTAPPVAPPVAPIAASDGKAAPPAQKAPPAKRVEKSDKKADDAFRPPAPAAKTE